MYIADLCSDGNLYTFNGIHYQESQFSVKYIQHENIVKRCIRFKSMLTNFLKRDSIGRQTIIADKFQIAFCTLPIRYFQTPPLPFFNKLLIVFFGFIEFTHTRVSLFLCAEYTKTPPICAWLDFIKYKIQP